MDIVNNKTILKYYYDFIVQSSLTGLTFKKEVGNIIKEELSDVNYFTIAHQESDEKTYEDNLSILMQHIKNLSKKEKDAYKIIYFPFVNELIEVSKTREDTIYASPIYFIFNIDAEEEKLLDDLKNLSLNHLVKESPAIFEKAQIVFNTYYASNKMYLINYDEVLDLKKELDDKEFDKKYPIKDFAYFISVLKKYIEVTNIEMDEKADYVELLETFNKQLEAKLNTKAYLNKYTPNKEKSLIALVNVEKLVESDNITKGVLNAYKNAIIPHFDKIDEEDRLNRIFYSHPSQYFSNKPTQQSDKNTLNITKDKLRELQKIHLGSFNKSFAITLSQRLALSGYLSKMDIVPVNGPPGTGKTALLRAVFADYISKVALRAKADYDNVKKDPYTFIDTGRPILGTSSVRQAINNIIEGISGGFKDAKEEGLLYERWLDLKEFEADVSVDLIEQNCVVPQIRNSENKYENGVLFTSVAKIFDYIASQDPKKLEASFLEKLNETYDDAVSTLDEAIELLFQRLNRDISTLENKIEIADESELVQVCQELDTSERFDIFFISIHLLEAFFIINLKRLSKKSNGKCPICEGDIENINALFKCRECDFKIFKNDKFNDISIATLSDLQDLLDNALIQNEKTYGIKYYDGGYKITEIDEANSKLASNIENINLITPLFPMLSVTMHSLFGAFKKRVDEKYTLMYDFFDLVLSDESGMILAPIGLPALFVAKKMIIVGDEKQIEPVYPFDELIDKSIVKNLSESIDYDSFYKHHSAIKNNFLTMANKATHIDTFLMQKHENNQLWLKEHFRCKDEIVDYCNEIIYNGILIPMVRADKKAKYLDDAKSTYPSMKLFDIESVVQNNRSKLEAQTIVKFLIDNISELCKNYNKFKSSNISVDDFHEHIGIVTPFNNQKKLLMQELKRANKYNLSMILVGTVHAFQGSEREIIIFSPSVDKNYSGTHFTNIDDGNMMNVAVSRAKSAFWVVGSKAGLKNAGEYTKTLVEYIDEHFSCELKCPKCGACIVEQEKLFKCETQKYDFKTKTTSGCDFLIWKDNKKLGKVLEYSDVLELLESGELDADKKVHKELKESDKFYFYANDKLFKNFRNEDFTQEEALKLLKHEEIRVNRVSKEGKPYSINVKLKDDESGFVECWF